MPKPEFIVRRVPSRDVTVVAARSGRAFARHSHDEFGIGALTRGAQRSWSGRGAVEAKQGDVITVNPGEVHDGTPVGAERSWSMLYLSPRLVRSLVKDITDGRAGSCELHSPVVSDTRALKYFEAAYSAMLTAHADSEERLLLLLAILLRQECPHPAIIPDTIAFAQRRIDEDPSAAHPLHELAALESLSRFQTIRAFVRKTGFTPHDYVTQRRLDLARRLICGGSALTTAAMAAGFADHSHFHRSFVARYGFTPRAYAVAVC